MWWIAGEDYGRQVANAFNTEKSLNKDYVVQGSEPFTMQEAANIYVKNYTKENLTVGSLPLGMVKFMSIFMSPLKFMAKFIPIMNNNIETFEAQNTWNELGKPQITIEKFARKYN